VLLSPLDLRILLGIAAGKTQAAIGEELNLEQPAVSKLLGLCESRTNLRLVEQHGRRLALTPAGSELARAGGWALEGLADLRRMADALRAGSHGPIRLIASSSPGNYVLPEVIAAFVRAHPDADVNVEIMPVSKMWVAFEQGEFDFAVAPLRGKPDDLEFEALYDDPVVFFVAAGSPLAGEADLDFADLHEEVVIAQFIAEYWETMTRSLGVAGPSGRRHRVIISPEAIKGLVGNAFGVGVLLESAVRRELQDGTFVRLPIQSPTLAEAFGIVRRPSARLSPIAEEFRLSLRAHLAQKAGIA
jgi:DNA-binding transcriptional LysR family regulator